LEDKDMKNRCIKSKTGLKQIITIILLIVLLGAAGPLFAVESVSLPPQLDPPINTLDNALLIVLDNNRQFFTVDLNGQVDKIYHDGTRDVVGLLGILLIIALAYWLVDHETKKTTTYYIPTADQNQSCRRCQCNYDQPE